MTVNKQEFDAVLARLLKDPRKPEPKPKKRAKPPKPPTAARRPT